DRQQRLSGADVAGRLLAADVLLARLQRHAQRGVALRVDRYTDDPPRHVADVFVPGGEVGGVGPSISERHAESLGGSDGAIRAQLARRTERWQDGDVGGA